MNSDQNGHVILELCENGQIYGALEGYLISCNENESDNDSDLSNRDSNKSSKKQSSHAKSFPNLAGFCRHLGSSILEFEEASQEYPTECSRILTVLEDEALNSDRSTNLISAYLKKRIGYDAPTKATTADTQLQIRFEHDIFEDGE